MSGMDFPSIAAIMSSVSTKQRPRRLASRRPTADFPAPMKPMRMMFLRSGMTSLYRGSPSLPFIHRPDVETLDELVHPSQERNRHDGPDQSRQLRAHEKDQEHRQWMEP